MTQLHPIISNKHKKTLYDLLQNNPKQEVVGYFTVSDSEPIEVADVHEVARGDDETVAYREFKPYAFHTHPLSSLRMSEPPSGEDLMQALSWGYPDFNEEKRSCTWECVVASEGLWWYRATDGLRKDYFDLQDVDEEKQNYLAKQIVRYINVLGTLLKNKRIALREFIERQQLVDFYWMQQLIVDNPVFLEYLEKQFPLATMSKLAEIKYKDLRVSPGFYVLLEIN